MNCIWNLVDKISNREESDEDVTFLSAFPRTFLIVSNFGHLAWLIGIGVEKRAFVLCMYPLHAYL